MCRNASRRSNKSYSYPFIIGTTSEYLECFVLRIEILHAPAVWTLPVYKRYTNALLSMCTNTRNDVTASASSSPVCSNHILVVLKTILNNIGVWTISTNTSPPSAMSDDDISNILSHKYHLVGNNAHWMFDCTYDEAKT